MEFNGRISSGDVYRRRGQDSFSVLLYTVAVSIPVTMLGLEGGRGGMSDGEKMRKRRGGGREGGRAEGTKGCRTVSAY